jgi:hypothetical protein
MRAIAFLLGVALAGCLEPSLKVCGTLACPDGTACVAIATNGPTCLPIAGCDSAGLGEPCDPGNGQEGTCEGGGCRPIERCGNGIVDSGESCDCGDVQITPRADCSSRNNSDTDPLAPCRGDCQLRTCGDEQLDATEQCEGTAIAEGLTCETFGYYDGELACSQLCIVDRSACSRRCGDGTIDTDHEYCDPTATGVVGYCTDFAFSSGTLRCGGTCGPDFRDCTDPHVFSDLLPGRTDLVEIVAGPTPTSAWIAAKTQAWLYDEETGLRDLQIVATPDLVDLSSSGQRVAFALANGTIYLHDETGARLDTLVAPFVCYQIVMTSEHTLVCLGSNNAAWWSAGTWGTPIASWQPWDAIARPDGSVFYSVAGSSVHHLTQSTDVAMPASGGILYFDELATGIAPTTAGLYGGLIYGGSTYGMTKLFGNAWGILEGTGGYYGAASIGGRTIWKARANGGTISIAPPALVSGPVDGTTTPCLRMLTTGSTALCLATNFDRNTGVRLLRYGGATVSQTVATSGIPVETSSLSDAFINAQDRIYYVSKTGNLGGTVPATSWRPPTPGTGIPTYDQIADARDGNVLLLGRPSSSPTQTRAYALWTDNTWSTGATTQPITAAALLENREIVIAHAAGLGNCTFSRGVPGSLTVIDTSPCPRAFYASPERIWAVAGGVVRDVTFGVSHDLFTGTPAPTSGWISGISDREVYAVMGSQIWFWDGITWSLQLDAPNEQFDWVHATPRGVIATSRAPVRSAWYLFTGSGTPTWNKLRLPSDPTPFLEPMLRPWGVMFRAQDNTLRYSVWQDRWPE